MARSGRLWPATEASDDVVTEIEDAAGAGAASTPSMRTCIGCRGRDDRSALLKVVAIPVGDGYVVRPDPRRRMPGRGASVHSTLECFSLAVRRKAFPRALRVSGRIDLEELAAYLHRNAGTAQHTPSPPTRVKTVPKRTEGGFDADEHPMSTQR